MAPNFKNSLHTNPQFLSLIPLCRKTQDLKAFNSLLITNGLIKHHPLIEQFIKQCCHLGFPSLALSPFQKIKKPSLYLQNLLLRSLSDNGLFQDVIFVHKSCRNSGCQADNYTYPFVIRACAYLGDVNYGKLVHCVAVRTGFAGNVVLQTAVLDFYFKVGEVDDARKVVDEIPEMDLVAWNSLISGYAVNGFAREVFRVLREMCGAGVKVNASTLASVLPVCSRVGGIGLGVSVHGLVCKVGYSKEEFLAPALISMYANSGDVLAARSIFDASTRNGVAIWNAMIYAYTRNHKPDNAVSLFGEMLRDDMKPNAATFLSLLPSCENLGSICGIELFHAYVVKSRLEKQLSVATTLLSVYAKLDNIVAAKLLFQDVHVRNLHLWNSMVSAYVGNGLWKQSLDAFSAMQRDGFVPDAISSISILSSCSNLEATLLGKSVHAFCLRKGLDLNLNVSNAFLALYRDCNELSYSFRIFDRMVLKNVVSWNTIISGCVDNGESERAMLLFRQMSKEGVCFDLVTLISIIPLCHECQDLMLGLTMHGHATKTALASDISLANALVSMYINCGEFDAAKLLFGDMPNKSVISWNAILTGCRYHGLQKETFELFNQMTREDQKPNYVTLLNILPACHTLLQGKSIHAYIFRRVIPLEIPLLTSLMIIYARFENLAQCLILFHMGEKQNISLWNTVMSAHLLAKNGARAFLFYCELLRDKIEPDDVTVLNLISACVQLKNLYISNSVLAYVVKSGFDKDITITNALIDLYAKCGSVSSARKLFDEFQQRDTISWSVMINGHGLHGEGEAALSLYSQMRLQGFKPDRVSYISILSACSHSGLVEEGRMVFDSMMRDGVFPSIEHYACMVDLLGRTGHLDEACEIVKNLPDKPSANLLESLLGACLSHGNYRLGEEIGKMVLQMAPTDSGPFVILYNIYAAAGKWQEANNVRLMMEQNQFFKSPGVSLVETCIHKK